MDIKLVENNWKIVMYAMPSMNGVIVSIYERVEADHERWEPRDSFWGDPPFNVYLPSIVSQWFGATFEKRVAKAVKKAELYIYFEIEQREKWARIENDLFGKMDNVMKKMGSKNVPKRNSRR